jgi:hypothetical protein
LADGASARWTTLSLCVIFNSFMRIVSLDSDDRVLMRGASAVTVTVS